MYFYCTDKISHFAHIESALGALKQSLFLLFGTYYDEMGLERLQETAPFQAKAALF